MKRVVVDANLTFRALASSRGDLREATICTCRLPALGWPAPEFCALAA